MDFKIFPFVLIAIIAKVHLVDCVTCRFDEYTCEINSQIIDTEDDMLKIDGEHLSGINNDDVIWLEAKASEILMFSSLIIDQFINLKYLEIANVRMKEISRPIKKCFSLFYIFMDGNEFHNLSGGIFAGCPGLSSISMNNCQLRTIDAHAIVGTSIRMWYV